MKKIKLFFAALALAVVGTTAFVAVPTVGALDPLADVCDSSKDSAICKNQDDDLTKTVGDLVKVLLFVVGLLAVVMIIVSGIFYVISTGDAPKVAKAKNTLTYSIVGLIVALLAYAIISWVQSIIK